MAAGGVDDSIGRLAVQMRLLSEDDLKEAVALAARDGSPLELVLLERGFLKQKDVEMLQVAMGTTGVIRRRPRP